MFGMLSRLDRMVIRETLRSVGYTLAVVLVLGRLWRGPSSTRPGRF